MTRQSSRRRASRGRLLELIKMRVLSHTYTLKSLPPEMMQEITEHAACVSREPPRCSGRPGPANVKRLAALGLQLRAAAAGSRVTRPDTVRHSGLPEGRLRRRGAAGRNGPGRSGTVPDGLSIRLDYRRTTWNRSVARSSSSSAGVRCTALHCALISNYWPTLSTDRTVGRGPRSSLPPPTTTRTGPLHPGNNARHGCSIHCDITERGKKYKWWTRVHLARE